MKQHLQQLLSSALTAAQAAGELTCDLPTAITIERARDRQHGDFASNLAMVLAKAARQRPRDLAALIIRHLPSSDQVANVEIAGPGFINFFMTPLALQQVVAEVLTEGERYGHSTIGRGARVLVEFVSANPTGPLHVGHGRGAAYGATVADLLAAVGFSVDREYYVNDAGRQMDILATSVWLRYLALCGESVTFPSNGYRGDYVWDIAATLHRELVDELRAPAATIFNDLPADEPDGGDKEQYIDALVALCRQRLGADRYRRLFDAGLNAILDDIREDLAGFGVTYQRWYSERSLVEGGQVDQALQRLADAGYLYEKDGAQWFRSTHFGDEKDRVVVRENGIRTYFASDIAYHAEKLERGYQRVIDIWGADHHGYVPRVKAALSAIGDDPARLDVLLVQFAILYRGGEKAQMSTRSGEFVTLRELREEVGNDAARFFYVMRKCEQHLDFDLDLAKSQSADNPVYYIQYAHARVHSVLRQLAAKGLSWDQAQGLRHLNRLAESHEQQLLMALSHYPEILEAAALAHEPHQIAHYLRDLANSFHTYYNAHTFIVEDSELRDARLTLIQAVRQVLHNGLELLGVSAPEQM